MSEKLNRIIFGYDFFISYSRKDTSAYASHLANEIIKRGYSCYLDQWGSDPGKKLPKKLESHIKRSSVFVLLASNEALQSEAVYQEIEIFLSTKRTIIPVDLSNIYDAIWFRKIEGIAVSDEKDENSIRGKASTRLLERIHNSFIYMKQAQRIKYSAFSAIILVITSVVISLFIFNYMKVKVEDIKIKNKQNEIALAKSKTELIIKKDSLGKINTQLILKKRDLDLAIERQKQAKLLADKFENDSKNYFTIANKANANGKKLFLELRQLCFNEYKQPNLIDKNYKLNLNSPVAIFFDFDRSNLSKEGAGTLDNLINILKQYPDQKIRIETIMSVQWLIKSDIIMDDINNSKIENLSAGELKHYYTDSYANNICNRRGKSIAFYIISKGIERNRIIISSRGNNTSRKTLKDYMGDRADIYLLSEK